MTRLLIIMSALLYVCTINHTSWFWPLIVVFLIPLFPVALNKKLTFADGFLWGIVFFSTHLWDIAHTIFAMGEGKELLRIIPGIFIIFYMALYPAIWFFISQKIITFLEIKKISTIVFTWTLTCWIYIYCIDHYSLWIFNRIEGYPLVHPLLALTEKPQLLTLLPLFGKSLLTLFLLSTSATFFLFIYTHKIKWLLVLSIFSLPWIISPLFFNAQKDSEWANSITHLPIVFPQGLSPQAMIYGAAHTIKKTVFYKPNTDIIIFPESSFYCDLYKNQSDLHAWSEKEIGKKIHIIVGAFRQNNKEYYNCLYSIYNGTIQTYHDKKHTMPLIEQIPPWFNWSWLKKIYFYTNNQLSVGHMVRPQFKLLNGTAMPYICSELYFNDQPDDQYPKIPIILASNDRWFSPTYIPRLLLRVAQLKAIQWQRPIMYCSFYYNAICSANGHIQL